jgi:hypothetical protein
VESHRVRESSLADEKCQCEDRNTRISVRDSKHPGLKITANGSQLGAKPVSENPLRFRRQFPANDTQELSRWLKGAPGKQSGKLIVLRDRDAALPRAFSKVVEP